MLHHMITGDAPDTVFAGYPANPNAGYRIYGEAVYRISDQIFGLTPTLIKIGTLVKYQFKF
jgi:hypothetical protein